MNLDALLVMGDARANTIMTYLTNGAHENALVVKRRGGPLTLIHGAMERDNAATTGLASINRDTAYNAYEMLKKHDGDRLAARVDTLFQVIGDQQLHGRSGVYGMVDAGEAFGVLTRLQQLVDGEIVGEYGDTLFTLARQTKDNAEIAYMAQAGRCSATCQVVAENSGFDSELFGAQRGGNGS